MKNSSKGKVKIQPLGDRVLVKVADEKAETKTASGIIIPGTVGDDRGAKQGVVVATGEGRVEEGKKIPMTVKVGDTVLFQWGDEIKIEGETYNILSESSILAVIK